MNYTGFGIVHSDLTKYVVSGVGCNASGYYWDQSNQTSTTWAATPGTQTMSGALGPTYVTVNDNGTNLTMWVSSNPFNLQALQIAQNGRTSYITGGPNKVGIGITNQNTTTISSAYVFHWTGV